LQNLLGLRLDGAVFLFFTDSAAVFPGGPNFSPQFYVTILGLVSGACSLIGIALYRRFLAGASFRRVLRVSNLLQLVVSACGIAVFARWNLRVGLPDQAFVLGSGAVQQIVAMLGWMPGTVLISQLCPKGREACVYAIVAGMMNLGSNLALYLGQYLLDLLAIRPNGGLNDPAAFQNLWVAATIATVLPSTVLLLLPTLIPPGDQGVAFQHAAGKDIAVSGPDPKTGEAPSTSEGCVPP
jgi:hypothetical protein